MWTVSQSNIFRYMLIYIIGWMSTYDNDLAYQLDFSIDLLSCISRDIRVDKAIIHSIFFLNLAFLHLIKSYLNSVSEYIPPRKIYLWGKGQGILQKRISLFQRQWGILCSCRVYTGRDYSLSYILAWPCTFVIPISAQFLQIGPYFLNKPLHPNLVLKSQP